MAVLRAGPPSPVSLHSYLLAIPGHLAPVAGGEIGTIQKLDTPHPELLMSWPGQGKLRLRGSLVHTKAKYLTLVPKVCTDYLNH